MLISCEPVTPRCSKARCFAVCVTLKDHAQIKEWAPLVMEGRDPQQKVAATRTEIGTDVNYGEITRQLIASLQKKSNFSLQLSSEVRALKRNDDNTDSYRCRSEKMALHRTSAPNLSLSARAVRR